MAMLMNCILLVFFLSLDPVHGEIVEGPRNTLTVVGEKTILKCCLRNRSHEYTWFKYIDDGLKQTICSNGTCRYNRNYEIDTTVPECNNLVIVSSSKNDSTLYECNDGTGNIAIGYVATYSCNTNISNEDDIVEGDSITFRCHIMSHNKPKFYTYWKYANGTIANGIHSYENQTQYESVLTVTAQHPELLLYTWTLEFLISSVGDKRIDISTSTANWTSKRIKVAYPVTNIRTDCLDGACKRVLGDSIRCLANGYPSPEFSWLNENDVEICRGPMLKLNSPETQKYTCVAKNSIRGTTYTKSIVAKVFIRETERNIYSLFVIIMLLLIGFFTYRVKVIVWRIIKLQFGQYFNTSCSSIATPEDKHLHKNEERVEESHSPCDDDDDDKQFEEKEPNDSWGGLGRGSVRSRGKRTRQL